MKKILSLVFCLSLALTALVGLSGCKEAHNHAFKGEIVYSIDEDKVYGTQTCECGEKETKLVENAVIANKDNAQDILDSDINGKIIVFDEGEYGKLEIRATSATAKAYTYNTENPKEIDLSNPVQNIEASTKYNYIRELTNVVFVGVENAVFTNQFKIESQPYATTIKDYVKGKTGVEYVSHIFVENVAFTKMNFTGKYAEIYCNQRTVKSGINNLTISNCNFYMDEYVNKRGVITLTTANDTSVLALNRFKNINILNNTIDGPFQGVYIINGSDVNVLNNFVTHTTHNAFAFQSTSDGNLNSYFTGYCKIKNNTVKDITDRAIRFNTIQNAQLIIEDNTFINCVDEKNEIMTTYSQRDADKSPTSKPNTNTNATFSFKNNTYNGALLDNVELDTETMQGDKAFTIKIETNE